LKKDFKKGSIHPPSWT